MSDPTKPGDGKKKEEPPASVGGSQKTSIDTSKNEKGISKTWSKSGPETTKTTETVQKTPDGPQKVSTSEKSAPGKASTFDMKEGAPKKTTTKVTVASKEYLPDQSGYAGPSAGDKDNNIGLLYGKVSAKSEISYDLTKKEANLTVIKAEAKGSVVHAEGKKEFNVSEWVSGLFGGKPDAPPKPAGPGAPPTVAPGPFAARVGDPTSHGSPLAPGIGSINVIIGGMPAWRATIDTHLCPIVKGLIPDVGGMVMMGSPTVLINGMMACRMGDMVVEIPGGPNPIAMGCPTVMIGTMSAGGGGGGGGGGPPKPSNDLKVGVKGKGDLLTAEANAELAAKFTKDEISAKAKAGALAAVAKGTIEGNITIPIPFTDHAITLGASGEGTLLSAGAEAEAGAGWTKEKGWQAKVGAKAALGGGLGFGFSIGFK